MDYICSSMFLGLKDLCLKYYEDDDRPMLKDHIAPELIALWDRAMAELLHDIWIGKLDYKFKGLRRFPTKAVSIVRKAWIKNKGLIEVQYYCDNIEIEDYKIRFLERNKEQ